MARPLKLVFYIHALAGGGAERVWSVLASRYAALGHEVILAVDYDAAENQGFVGPGVRLVVLGGGHARTIGRLARLMRRETPDIVISALAAANLKLTVAAALAGCLRQTVLSYHGYAETEPQRLSQWGYRIAGLLTRVTARSVAVSDGLADYMRQDWNACARRLVRIYNPVEVRSGGATTAADLAARPPLVLAAGRFVSYKNFTGLLRAFAALGRPEARLVILGDGDERPVLEAEAARLGLGDRVEMPGYVPDPWRHFDQARVFVLPSTSEPFGLVLVEAMARGLDVVATDCHGPREILDGGRYGRLVACGDAAALRNAMASALDAPADPAPRVERARAFDVTTAVEHYEDLFRTVVAENELRRGQGESPAPLRDGAIPAEPA